MSDALKDNAPDIPTGETTDSSAAPTDDPAMIAVRHLLKRMYDECGPEAWQKFSDRVNSGEHDVPSPWAAPKPDPPQEFEEWWSDYRESEAFDNVSNLTDHLRNCWHAARKAPSDQMREALEALVNVVGQKLWDEDCACVICETEQKIYERHSGALFDAKQLLSKATREVK